MFIQGRAVEGVQPFQRRHDAAGARSQARAYRQVLLQYHFQRLETQAALLQRLAIGDPAVMEDVLFRVVRQLVGVTAHGRESERHLCRFDLDAVPSREPSTGASAAPRTSKPTLRLALEAGA